MAVEIRDLRPSDRSPLEVVLRGTGAFTEEEVGVALELIDVGLGLAPGDGYWFAVAEDDGEVAGYACWGAVPMTAGTFDLYWIAVATERAGRGIGRRLMAAAEDAMASAGGRLVIVETAGKASYAATRAFYVRLGYVEEARLRDFYQVGDDKVIFTKSLAPG